MKRVQNIQNISREMKQNLRKILIILRNPKKFNNIKKNIKKCKKL